MRGRRVRDWWRATSPPTTWRMPTSEEIDESLAEHYRLLREFDKFINHDAIKPPTRGQMKELIALTQKMLDGIEEIKTLLGKPGDKGDSM